jgi:hypothetical protein
MQGDLRSQEKQKQKSKREVVRILLSTLGLRCSP